MYKLYSMQRFGQQLQGPPCAALLRTPYHAIESNISEARCRTPGIFLAKNPSGQVPAAGSRRGALTDESKNAIRGMFAIGHRWPPESARSNAPKALQWMFFATACVEPNIGAAISGCRLVKGGRDLRPTVERLEWRRLCRAGR